DELQVEFVGAVRGDLEGLGGEDVNLVPAQSLGRGRILQMPFEGAATCELEMAERHCAEASGQAGREGKIAANGGGLHAAIAAQDAGNEIERIADSGVVSDKQGAAIDGDGTRSKSRAVIRHQG